MWRSGTSRWNLRVPGLHMSCRDLNTWEDTRKSSPNNGHSVTCSFRADSLGLCPANERQCYFVTTSLIGWAQAYNQPCSFVCCPVCVCVSHVVRVCACCGLAVIRHSFNSPVEPWCHIWFFRSLSPGRVISSVVSENMIKFMSTCGTAWSLLNAIKHFQ